ncbi:MAG: hypothetical protein V5A88_05500 [Candidatus Thermoplasmatota archaeon]
MDKTPAVLVSIILILGIVSSLMGCTEEDEPAIELDILDIDLREYDESNHRAPDGHIFLYLQVHLRNQDEDSELYPVSRDFELDTDSGNTHNHHDVIGFPDQLEPGEEVDFWISFEIGEEETGDILRYDPNWPQKDAFEEKIPSYEGDTKSDGIFIQLQKIRVTLSSGHRGVVNRKVRTISKL